MLLNSKPVLYRTSLTTADYIAARNNAVWGQASLSHPCGSEYPVATNRVIFLSHLSSGRFTASS
ncbi:hypothetical protein T4E_1808 [Trichinella pseudospiralis]|uniref:Uncharacterized protein n=1 Tax=Trichinella pseudospiralis TaxID=6337 RepID=A0A0V0XK71_TRIPS|nr:hypothetical protein T4E_1808 [Trichinella pseudospiralis]